MIDLQAANTLSSENNYPLLTFTVNGQLYALPITQVVRVIEMVTLVQIRDLAHTVAGVINVQGQTVPVVDVRQRIGAPAQQYGLYTPIILVNFELTADNTQLLGLVVDAVQQVVYVDPDTVARTLDKLSANIFGEASPHHSYALGFVTVSQTIITILDLAALLSAEVVTQLEQTDFTTQ